MVQTGVRAELAGVSRCSRLAAAAGGDLPPDQREMAIHAFLMVVRGC